MFLHKCGNQSYLVLFVAVCLLLTSCKAKIGTAEYDELLEVGLIFYNKQDFENAEEMFRAAVTEARKRGLQDPALALSLNYLGVAYYAQNKYSDAKAVFQQALGIWEKTKGPNSLEVATVSDNLGHLCLSTDKPADAEKHFKRAFDIRWAEEPHFHPAVLRTLDGLVLAYFASQRYEEAQPYVERLVEGYERTKGPNAYEVGTALNNLGYVLFEQRNFAEAEEHYKHAIAVYDAAPPADHPEKARVLNNLAELYLAQERYEEAESLYRRSVPIVEKHCAADGLALANILEKQVTALRAMGRKAEADSLESRARAIRVQGLEAVPRAFEGRREGSEP